MAILIVSWFAVALNPRHDKLRIRYFLAFLLTWVLGGNLLAYALSSAGPAFLEHMGAVATAAAPRATGIVVIGHRPFHPLKGFYYRWNCSLVANLSRLGETYFPEKRKRGA
jgi:hypothetical protein